LSVLIAFFDADGFAFGAFDLAARGEALVAKYTQRFDFWALTATFAEFEHFDIAWARQAIIILGFFPLGQGAPKHQQFADVLNWSSIQFVSQGEKHGFAGGAIIGKDAHLDQAVGIQGGVGFFFDGGGQAIAANHHHGVEVVRVSSMGFALGWGQ
jgi:hypothetical protein